MHEYEHPKSNKMHDRGHHCQEKAAIFYHSDWLRSLGYRQNRRTPGPNTFAVSGAFLPKSS